MDLRSSFWRYKAMSDEWEKSIRVSFGDNLREIRKNKGFSQESLALACGLDRTYIGGVERGERNIILVNICKIADTLELHPAELMKGMNT